MKKSGWFNKRNIVGAIGAALLAVGASANAGVIDQFTTSQGLIKSDVDGVGLGTIAGSAGDTSILGGFRNLYVQAVSGAVAPTPPNTLSIGTQIGVFQQGGIDLLSFSNDSGVTGYGEVVWQGNNLYGPGKNLVADGLGGIDITAGGTLTDFLVETIESDLGWNFQIYMYSSAVDYTVVNLAATAVPPGPSLTTIPFSAFTAFCPGGIPFPGGGAVNSIECFGAGANPASVGALRAVLNVGADGNINGGTTNIDLRLGSVTTVPEPATLTLMGLGLLAAGGLGMRRRNKMNA